MLNSSPSLETWCLERLDRLDRMFAVPLRTNPYIEHIRLWPMQQAFLVAEGQPGIDETLYGGGAGPGKSFGLVYWALQYVDVPGYKAGLFRNTIGELHGTDGLIPITKQVLAPAVDRGWCSFNENRREWIFASGAKVVLGGLFTGKEIKRLDGWSFQRVVLDELTGWVNDKAYLRAISRLRRLDGFPVRPSIAAGSNPDGPGRKWVGERFGLLEDTEPEEGCFYVHTTFLDSKGLDQEDYGRKLDKLGEVLRKQKKEGDWNVVQKGPLWGDGHFPYYEEDPRALVKRLIKKPGVRLFTTWDCKNKLETSLNPRKGESFVSGALWLAFEGRIFLLDEEHGPYGFNDTVHAFYRLLRRWQGYPIEHHIENKAMGPALLKQVKRGGKLVEVGPSGETLETVYPRVSGVLPHNPEGDKLTRGAACQTYVHAGDMLTPQPRNAPFVRDWRSEVSRTPLPPNDRGDTAVMAVEVGIKNAVVRPTRDQARKAVAQVAKKTGRSRRLPRRSR